MEQAISIHSSRKSNIYVVSQWEILLRCVDPSKQHQPNDSYLSLFWFRFRSHLLSSNIRKLVSNKKQNFNAKHKEPRFSAMMDSGNPFTFSCSTISQASAVDDTSCTMRHLKRNQMTSDQKDTCSMIRSNGHQRNWPSIIVKKIFIVCPSKPNLSPKSDQSLMCRTLLKVHVWNEKINLVAEPLCMVIPAEAIQG